MDKLNSGGDGSTGRELAVPTRVVRDMMQVSGAKVESFCVAFVALVGVSLSFLAGARAADAEPRPQFVLDKASGRLEYEQVVKLQGKSADQLFALAEQWVAEMFKDADSVIQLSDANRGKLMARGWWEGMSFGLVTPKIWFDTVIEVKDGRYRLTFTRVVMKAHVMGEPLEFLLRDSRLFNKDGKKQIKRREQFTARFHNMADSLRRTMGTDYVEDDW